MKKISKMQIFVWILALVPLALVAVFYDRFPESVPYHWGLDGSVKLTGKPVLWWFAGTAPLCAALFWLLPRLDPKRDSYRKFGGAYLRFQAALMLFLTAIMGIQVTESLRPGTLSVGMAVCLLAGLLLVLIGNRVPQFRQNFFCGYKNPWTLSSEAVWMRTHRLAGRMLFAAGLIGIVCAFLPQEGWRFAVFLTAILTAAILPTLMSYLWYRRQAK